ncbi:MAG TPA: PAS domain-containing protein [Devosia sp.]|jgi:PAS domain S-box-containing protein|nr:PAS domain-containing protein [Devosia sp.]
MPNSLFPAADAETRALLEQDPTLKLVNEFDWSATPLGPIPEWPESLKGAVRVMMGGSTPMAMLVGPNGILVYNDAYGRFAGGRHPAIMGMAAVEAWPEAAEFNRDKIERGLAGLTTRLDKHEMLLNRDGEPELVWLELHYSPILGEDGAPLGSLAVLQDLTARVLAEQALARSEERLSLALEGSDLVGTWDWDIVNDVVTADDRFATLFNIDPLQAGLGLPIAQFLAAIHPEDQARTSADIEASLRDGTPLRSQYRVISADGQVHWVVASGRPRAGGDGKPSRFPGVVVDVTEQRRISDALLESELRFRTLADTMPQMVWSTLPDGFHDYYNKRWYEFTGVPEGTTDGTGWNDLFHPDDQERAWKVWRHSLETGEPYNIEYRLRHHSGSYRWTLGLALPIRDASGEIVRWFGTCTDIHETKQVAEERELVAQELSHRIKNIFAVLTGIISLSARSRPEVKDFAEELRQRIYALGEAHDFLRPNSHISRPPEKQGSLRSLVERLMQPYQDDGAERLVFEGDDVTIDEGAATPLALLFHELGTNAAKYGALSSGGGRVTLVGRADGERYHLVWQEKGGPAIAEDAQLSGFGSRLIGLSIEGQLRGTLQRRWEADGLRVDISLPVDALRRPAKLRR